MYLDYEIHKLPFSQYNRSLNMRPPILVIKILSADMLYIYIVGLDPLSVTPDYHINVHMQENFHNLFTLEIRGA